MWIDKLGNIIVVQNWGIYMKYKNYMMWGSETTMTKAKML